MKKLGMLVLMFLVAAGVSFAAEGDNVLTVNATIAPVLTATFGAGHAATISFDALSGTGTKQSTTADLTIISNYPHWTVTFASQNSSADKGKLKDTATTEPAASLSYNLKASLTTTGWANSTNVTNDLSAFQAMSANHTIGLATGNGKTLVSGVVYQLQASLDMPTGAIEMYETGKTFTDTILITIANNA